MIKTYIKIALRSLRTNSLFSVLNILGLSIGLAITILLFVFISNELNFDRMYSKNKDIYRVLLRTEGDNKQVWATSPSAVALNIKADIPDIKFAARMLKHNFGSTAFIKTKEDNFAEKGLYWCDSDIFNIFDIPFVTGNPATALARPNTVVISQSTARKYFGNRDAMGETITVDNKTPLEVTGVYNDLPETSTIDCGLIASFSSSNFAKRPTWDNASFETFCLLNSNASLPSVQQKIQQVVDKNIPKKDQWYSFSLQPLSRVHLYSTGYSHSYSSRIGDISEIKSLSLLALVVLLIACINYMNLITARSQKKMKDVGINKTLGASMQNLVIRFYTETGLLTLIALLVGVLLATLFIPVFNSVASKHLSISAIYNLKFSGWLLMIWAVTTFIAGSYPALHLSRFMPKQVMQQSFHKGTLSAIIRKGLVVLQFACSIILIVGVIVIYRQLQFMRDKNLGYNPENVIAISTSGAENKEQASALANEFGALSMVASVARTQGFPGMNVSSRSVYKSDADEEGLSIQTNRAENGFEKVLQLKMLAGTSLPQVKQPTDTIVDVILNKKAVDYLGFTPEQAIGKKVTMQLGSNAYVVGVVDNFNFQSLHVPLGAYAFHNRDSEPKQFLLVRFRTGDLSQTMEKFRQAFKTAIPNSAFEYTFLDKELDTLYATDKRMASVGLAFSILAIFVACLGLFGLAAYTAEQRIKEIGIRKVLGATVSGITALLTGDFIRLIIISLIIAFPLAFWAMSKWLQDFAYRIQIQWWIFLLAGSVAILIALITVGFQAVKAAVANPVKSLRSQ